MTVMAFAGGETLAAKASVIGDVHTLTAARCCEHTVYVVRLDNAGHSMRHLVLPEVDFRTEHVDGYRSNVREHHHEA